MSAIQNKIRNLLISCFLIFILSSCILDEFKADEIKMKEDWNLEIVSPLFRGNFEFKDLIHDWKTLDFLPEDQISYLKFPDDRLLEIPSRIIFEEDAIIDNFEFLIGGKYKFSKVYLKYEISNGAPFPLNLQMCFFEKMESAKCVAPILPPPFLEAEYDGLNFTPVQTTHFVTLNSEQLESLTKGNRVQFSTWFNKSDMINTKDTFLSNYPVKISILLYGELETEI